MCGWRRYSRSGTRGNGRVCELAEERVGGTIGHGAPVACATSVRLEGACRRLADAGSGKGRCGLEAATWCIHGAVGGTVRR